MNVAQDWTVATTARIGLLADGRMGASPERAARIQAAMTAAQSARGRS